MRYMGDLEDPQRFSQKFDNQMNKLHTAGIPDADKETIKNLIYELDGSGSIEKSTIVSYLSCLLVSAEKADTTLVSMEKSDFDELMFKLKHDRGLAEGTLRNYRKALKRLFEFVGKDWSDDIEIGASPDRTVDPNDLPTENEVKELINCAPHPREKALIAILADAGLRIGAAASLRVRDIDFVEPTATVTINDNANVKGASGKTPLIWSEKYVANWLDVHPRREADAPLFHKKKGYYDESSDSDGSLTTQYLGRRIRKVAKDTSVDEDKVNPHNFRKYAISSWIRQGLSEQDIKHRAHWDIDSNELDTYSAIRDEEHNDRIRAEYGIETAGSTQSTLSECPKCREPLRDEAEFCSACGKPLTAKSAVQVGRIEDDIVESLGADDMSHADLLKTLYHRFQNDPEMRDLMAQV